MVETSKKIIKFPSKSAQTLIKLYQNTLSPDHGWLKVKYPYGYCRFYPSCSQYGYEALENFGIIKGVPLTIWRVLRCNPFAESKIDKVPKPKKPSTAI